MERADNLNVVFTTQSKRVTKRRAAMRKYTQCVSAYQKELKKAQGQTKGNSFVSAEEDPTVIECVVTSRLSVIGQHVRGISSRFFMLRRRRQEEQNQAHYLFQEEHNKLLEQIQGGVLHLHTTSVAMLSSSKSVFRV